MLPVAADRAGVEIVESIPFFLAVLGTDQMVEKADLMAGIIQFISADSLIELLLFLQRGTLFECCY